MIFVKRNEINIIIIIIIMLKMNFLSTAVQKLYRLDPVNSNTVNSKFHLIQTFAVQFNLK